MSLETPPQRNPFLLVVMGGFNAKSKQWCSQDSTSFEGIAIDTFMIKSTIHRFAGN